MTLESRFRLLATAASIALVFLLAVARSLEPDPRGHGTHEQLGLPPCSFIVLYGRPCPACGMTTAWAWVVRGRLDAAVCANTTGTILCILALIAAPWLVASAVNGRWFLWKPGSWVVLTLLGFVALAMLVEWGWRLFGGRYSGSTFGP
jgi:hypothetical protein